MWLVDSGLKGGDVVIVDGVARLMPGAPIKVAGPPGTKPAGPPGTPISKPAGPADAATTSAKPAEPKK